MSAVGSSNTKQLTPGQQSTQEVKETVVKLKKEPKKYEQAAKQSANVGNKLSDAGHISDSDSDSEK